MSFDDHAEAHATTVDSTSREASAPPAAAGAGAGAFGAAAGAVATAVAGAGAGAAAGAGDFGAVASDGVDGNTGAGVVRAGPGDAAATVAPPARRFGANSSRISASFGGTPWFVESSC